MMEGSYSSLLAVMVFLPLGLVCLPQQDLRNQGPAIQFPGHDAFDTISGLKNSSSTFPSAARPLPTRTTTQPPLANDFVPNVVTTERQSTSASESADCRGDFNWNSISPFPVERASTLVDTRLSIDSMFRISNIMERVLNDKNANIVFSPISFTSVLGQLMLASQGITLQELENLLAPGRSSCSDGAANQFHRSFQTLLPSLSRGRGDSESYVLSMKNALFHQSPGPNLRRQFTDLLSSYYITETKRTDFRNPDLAQRSMNEWGSIASRGLIPQLIPQPPSRTTSAVLGSVTYFKASWENLFNKRFTSPGSFFLDGHRNGRVKTVDFMVNEFEVPFAESQALGCRIIALPYINNETALYVVMPLGPPRRRRPLPTVQSLTPIPAVTPSPSSDGEILVSRIGEVEPEEVYQQNTFGNRVTPAKPPSVIHRLHTFFTTDSVLYPGNPHAFMYAYIQSSLQPAKRQKRQLQPCSSGSDGSVPCLEQRQGEQQEESPYSASNLHRLAARLGPSEFAGLISEMRVRKVSVVLPKLSMATNIKLKDVLHALGVPSLYGDGANLSGAVEEDGSRRGSARQEGGWWKVDEVWQQSKLYVDEYGTEAASGTAVSIIDYGGDGVVFKANSPFLAVIRHEATGAPIFWASVVNPS